MSVTADVSDLWDDLVAVYGQTGTYSDGVNPPLEIVSIPGRAGHDAETQLASSTSREQADWLFKADELLLIDGPPVEPQVGDTFTVGGVTYTVGNPDFERQWDWVSQARVVYRVHFYVAPQS